METKRELLTPEMYREAERAYSLKLNTAHTFGCNTYDIMYDESTVVRTVTSDREFAEQVVQLMNQAHLCGLCSGLAIGASAQ